MNTIELKSDLHKIIDNINDPEVLSTLKSFFSQVINKETDWWEMMPESEKKIIGQGIEQLNNKEGITHSEVREKVNLLLNKNE